MNIMAFIIAGILLISNFAAQGIKTSDIGKTKINIEEKNSNSYFIDYISEQEYIDIIFSEIQNKAQKISIDNLIKSARDWEIGEIIWQYIITNGSDNSVKAIASIPDINNDEIDDVIICSEDCYIRCFDGGAIGNGIVLWEHEIYSGPLLYQNGLAITEDFDNDGYNDIVIGTAGEDRSVHTLSGKTGDLIWTYDTHEYGDGSCVYQVSCSYDYNGDDLIDVLAATGGESDGPRRVYCLNGKNGSKILECPLGYPFGPVFSVIGIEDFTDDGLPDILAGASNSNETVGIVYGLNGLCCCIGWSFTVGGSSVWALEQIDDITEDGIKDVIIGDSFTGNIYGLDATGDLLFNNSLGSAKITRFVKLNDVNGDGHTDILPAHSSPNIIQIVDGYNGDFIWTHNVADQPCNVARIADISGDAIDDVIVGTLSNHNYCYFLNGTDGNELWSINYNEAVDAIAAIPDVTGDDSMEMVVGGRNGTITCFSGGLNALINDPPYVPIIDGPMVGAINVDYEFTFVTTDPDADDIYYYIEWGDGSFEDWIGPYEASEEAIVSHTWSSSGDFNIKAKAKDKYHFESDWSEIYPITIVDNSVPTIPIINGSKKGCVGILYTYNFTSTDLDGNNVSYFIKWGDDDTTGWTTYQASGTTCSEDHKWNKAGTFNIKVKVKDIYGAESYWGTFKIQMSRNKMVMYRFLQHFRDLFYRFQILNKLIFQ